MMVPSCPFMWNRLACLLTLPKRLAITVLCNVAHITPILITTDNTNPRRHLADNPFYNCHHNGVFCLPRNRRVQQTLERVPDTVRQPLVPSQLRDTHTRGWMLTLLINCGLKSFLFLKFTTVCIFCNPPLKRSFQARYYFFGSCEVNVDFDRT